MKLYKVNNVRIIAIDEMIASRFLFKEFSDLYKEVNEDPFVSGVHIFITAIMMDKEAYDIIRTIVNTYHNHSVTIHSRLLTKDRKKNYLNIDNNKIKNKFRVDGSKWVTFSLGNKYNLCFCFDNFGFLVVTKYKSSF